jgi:hypothetical protein
VDAQITAGPPGLEPDAVSIAGDRLPDATSRAANTRLDTPAAASTVDELTETYTLLQAASGRDVESQDNIIYDQPWIRVGLRGFLSDGYTPTEIYEAVMATVSRCIAPDRLVAYARAVLESIRQEKRETERLRSVVEETVQPRGPATGPPDQSCLFDTDAPNPPERVHSRLWEQALGELEMQMTRATFNTWLKPVALAGWTPAGNGTPACATLNVPNGYVADWLENRLYVPIRRTLSGIAGEEVEVQFIVENA